MENASKALLIAGSVLIVILLIALGVRIFNSTSGTADAVGGTMQAVEVAMFNNKFSQYIGERKSAKTARALAETVIAHNGAAKSESEKVRFSLYDKYSGSYCDTFNPNSILNAINNITTNRGNIYKLEIMAIRTRWFN